MKQRYREKERWVVFVRERKQNNVSEMRGYNDTLLQIIFKYLCRHVANKVIFYSSLPFHR